MATLSIVAAQVFSDEDNFPFNKFRIEWFPDGKLVVWSGNSDAQIWDGAWSDWDVNSKLVEQALWLSWSPNGEIIMTNQYLDNNIHFWDPETGDLRHEIVAHVSYISSLGWAPDGRSIASASSDGTIRIWSIPTE